MKKIRTVNTDITTSNCNLWLESFKNEVLPELEMLKSFYDGKNEINKLKTDLDKATGRVINEIHSNYSRMIVKNASSYLIGKPVSYTFKDLKLGEEVKKLFYKNEEESENMVLATNCSAYGLAFEFVGIKENKEVFFKALDTLKTFYVYNDSILEDVVCAITYWVVKDVITNREYSRGYIFTNDEQIEFDNSNGVIQFTSRSVNPFKPALPVIEFKNNHDNMSDYGNILDLLTAYSKLLSTNFDDVDSIANAILALHNASLPTDESGKLKRSSVLELMGDNTKAEYIYKKLDKEYVDYLRSAIMDDIFSITNIPNLTDEKFVGNSSGVALSYKLIGFDNLHQEKALFFKDGLMDRLKCYLNFKNFSNKAIEFESDDIKVTFFKNLPKNIENDLKIADLYTKGVLSKETAIEKLEIVDDVELEKERAKEEKATIEDEDIDYAGTEKAI